MDNGMLLYADDLQNWWDFGQGHWLLWIDAYLIHWHTYAYLGGGGGGGGGGVS